MNENELHLGYRPLIRQAERFLCQLILGQNGWGLEKEAIIPVRKTYLITALSLYLRTLFTFSCFKHYNFCQLSPSPEHSKKLNLKSIKQSKFPIQNNLILYYINNIKLGETFLFFNLVFISINFIHTHTHTQSEWLPHKPWKNRAIPWR